MRVIDLMEIYPEHKLHYLLNNIKGKAFPSCHLVAFMLGWFL
jgi:hypothetical protein